MDFTQQLKLPHSQSATPKQRMLIRVAVIGVVLLVLLMIISSLAGGKTSQPQMISALDSHTQLTTVSELVRDYNLSPSLQNTAASLQSTTTSSYQELITIAGSTYQDFAYKPAYDSSEVESSLEDAQQRNNSDEQARTILSNAIAVLRSDLAELRAATSNQDIVQAVDTELKHLEAFQAQLAGN